MKNIKEYLINCLLEENIITDAEVDYWYYRLEMYEGKMIHLLIIVFNCLLSKDKVAFLVYVIAFSLLRTHTGGYHSNSKLRCIFLSTLWYALVNFIVIPHVAGGSMSYELTVFTIISIITILVFAPVNHPNLNLDYGEYVQLKKIVRITLFIEIIVAVILLLCEMPYYHSIVVSIISCALFIIISKIFRQEVKCHEED